jgi:hypothetical protein
MLAIALILGCCDGHGADDAAYGDCRLSQTACVDYVAPFAVPVPPYNRNCDARTLVRILCGGRRTRSSLLGRLGHLADPVAIAALSRLRRHCTGRIVGKWRDRSETVASWTGDHFRHFRFFGGRQPFGQGIDTGMSSFLFASPFTSVASNDSTNPVSLHSGHLGLSFMMFLPLVPQGLGDCQRKWKG